MNQATFPHLFTPIQIGKTTIKNRIMSTGHDTTLPTDGLVNEAYLAYQEARALGGVGLIVLQVAAVHDSARYSSHVLMATDDKCVQGYRRMADICHRHGATVFGQLFHPGREIMETADGLAPVAYSSSATPQERFHVMPRELPKKLISKIVDGYAQAARRLDQAGLDGVEIVASHGYLPSQFLNPRINHRRDEYGGSAENRLRFLREVIHACRAATGDHFVIGLRICSREMDEQGLRIDETLKACQLLSAKLDYVNVIAGNSASLGGAVHIVPPMSVANAYLAPESRIFREALNIPVFVAGRINQPQEAESILARGDADIVGMTRALICDPQMPNKSRMGQTENIRACIACNQACIGHFHRGVPISCIQHPETGRELIYGFDMTPVSKISKKVMVVGGGPAGLKAASIASQAGHTVTLYEAGPQLGGQVLLAMKLPGRAEFGGLASNLTRELTLAGVQVIRNTRVDYALVQAQAPDVVIVATGAKPYTPRFENLGSMQVVNAWDLLSNDVKVGKTVLVADWKCDWIGIGIAEQLASNGHLVKLAVNGLHAGETLQSYTRDSMAARLHALGVEVIPYLRLYGCDDDTVYMQHIVSGVAVEFVNIDTLVLCQGHTPDDTLANQIGDLAQVYLIGDALASRTAEEAVFDGLRVAWSL